MIKSTKIKCLGVLCVVTSVKRYTCEDKIFSSVFNVNRWIAEWSFFCECTHMHNLKASPSMDFIECIIEMALCISRLYSLQMKFFNFQVDNGVLCKVHYVAGSMSLSCYIRESHNIFRATKVFRFEIFDEILMNFQRSSGSNVERSWNMRFKLGAYMSSNQPWTGEKLEGWRTSQAEWTKTE